MVVTSIAMIPVGTRYWKWGLAGSGALFGFFTLVNLLFFAASSLKFLEGGLSRSASASRSSPSCAPGDGAGRRRLPPIPRNTP